MWIPMARWIGACAVVVSTLSVAYAHHSITGVYDTRREVAVEGAVTEFHFVSPHPFVLARVDRNGAAEQWRFDMDNRNEMREIGVTADTLRVGDRVAVAGHPAREEPRRGSSGRRTDSASTSWTDSRGFVERLRAKLDSHPHHDQPEPRECPLPRRRYLCSRPLVRAPATLCTDP